ncbi:MAG TPA: 50S ribosomal protein L10 [Candidatus Omnitrophota bacterium]|nr:50S ribosomal protein L10 [Candidatus Omnitrophota bacterium]HPD83975.1 50S ribosomal protein L10 [Candidatus Omnitrophota bacterium]HRZ02832.1 50S ribosomal protein L10 [Candidatus Omnitrophota bacterium]
MKTIGKVLRENMVNRIKSGIDKDGSIFLISYSKISSGKMNDLRKALKKAGAKMYVSKNTIAAKALKDLKQDVLADRVHGQTAFVFCTGDSVEVSKALTNFAKTCEGLLFEGGLLSGKVLEKADIKRLADLPSREALLAMLLGTIQAPLTRFAGALTGKMQDLLSILKQLSEQKGGK